MRFCRQVAFLCMIGDAFTALARIIPLASGMRRSLALHMRTGRSWPMSDTPGDKYLDQFLHDRRPYCCPVVLGDPMAIKGDRTPPIFAELGHGAKL
jgi:hypothetical protein